MNETDAARLRRYRMQLFTATWLSYAGFYIARKVYPILKHPLTRLGTADDILRSARRPLERGPA